MQRRSALRIVAAGVLAERLDAVQHQLFQLAEAPAAYRLQFFTAEQHDALAALTETIIPADSHSPGAREANVGYYADLVVANSARPVQETWTRGLAAFDTEARRRYGSGFAKLSAEQRHEVVVFAARNETHPQGELENFFVTAKLMTIQGYYTSPIGIHRDIQYKGNTALPNYYGATLRPAENTGTRQ
jgi:hypothetical protein